ncbi:MAG: LytTR family DNA-binding domain-containing protein [Flavobacteriaceae bacterium]
MNVVIIEDEINAQEALIGMLSLIDVSTKILGTAQNVSDGIALINKTKPDIVFLDIQLRNGTGFDVLEGLDVFLGKVIFTTAYENYAIKAFKISAFDYILKPINPSELLESLKQAEKEILKETKYSEMLKVLEYNKGNEINPKIVLKTLNHQNVVEIETIIRCESEGAYTNFHFKNKKLLTSKNLKYYDELLSEHGFIRTHQSHLVNIKHVQRIHSNGFLEMKDKTKIPISSRKKASVNKFLKHLI